MTPDLHRLHAHLDALADVVEHLELDLADSADVPYATSTRRKSKRDRRNEEALATAEAMDAMKSLVTWFGHDREGLVGLWRGPEHAPLVDAPIVRLDGRGDFDLVATNLGDYFVGSVDEAFLDDTLSALDAAGFAHAQEQDEVWRSIENLPSPNTHRDNMLEASRLERGLTSDTSDH